MIVNIPRKIGSFQGEYRWLSNFWPAVVELDGLVFPTLEHAFHAAKTLEGKERVFIQGLPKPGDAKRFGRSLQLRPDWEEIKVDVMLKLLRQKFELGRVLSQFLLDTGDAELIEGNWWHDVFWGVCDGSGRVQKCPGHEPFGDNHLGRLLTQVRTELKDLTKKLYHNTLVS